MKALPLSIFPNSDIIKSLYQEIETNDAANTSSYWSEYGPQSKACIENNELKELSGIGFGDLRGGLPLLEKMTILTYQALLPQRKAIKKWMGYGQSIVSVMSPFSANFTYDIYRQCAIGAFLEEYIDRFPEPRIVLIGDGYGILSAILKMHFPKAKIFLVDIMPALLFQAVTLGLCHNEAQHELAKAGNDADFSYCAAGTLRFLDQESFDIAINVASMQEMPVAVVETYFSFLRSHLSENGMFYCCNRIEKKLPGGEVLKFFDYPWKDEDQYLIDESPNFYEFFFSRAKTKNVVKFFGVPVPFCRRFDGELWHRLSILSS